MEIQLLRFVATEADLNNLAAKLYSQKNNVRDIHINVVPQAIRVTGKYRAIIGIPFETLWDFSISDGRIAARLRN